MLLDDVMSELDSERRELLAGELSSGGQSVIATTDLAHVPGAGDAARRRACASRPGRSCRRRSRHEKTPPPARSSLALDGLTATLAPATTLARVQEVWERAAGPAIAAAARPTAERDGVLTVTCEAAVWAQELR